MNVRYLRPRPFTLAAVVCLIGFLSTGPGTWSWAPATPFASAGAAGRYPRHVLLIRHAEKPADKGDEHLSSRGAARAAAFPSLFFIPESAFRTKSAPFPTPDFIYATKASDQSNRPVETVQPLAKALGNMDIHAKHANHDFQPVVEHLLDEKHAGKTVLICWHHGQLPHVAKAILNQATNSDQVVDKVPKPWPDEVFDRVWWITFDQQGAATFADRPQKLLFGDSAE